MCANEDGPPQTSLDVTVNVTVSLTPTPKYTSVGMSSSDNAIRGLLPRTATAEKAAAALKRFRLDVSGADATTAVFPRMSFLFVIPGL